MNIIVASSRGHGLQEHLADDVTVYVRFGATLATLKAEAESKTAPSTGLGRRDHIYFLSGITDLTKLIKIKQNHYRECIFEEEPSEAADRYMALVEDCQRFFLQRGALPIFATVPKMHIEKYNSYLLEKRKTLFLNFTDKYSEMQSKLDTTIDDVNDRIYNINNNIQATTPFLHYTIKERRGTGCRYMIYRWDLLYDGLHAEDILHPKWAKAFTKAITQNSLLEDQERPRNRYSRFVPESQWSE